MYEYVTQGTCAKKINFDIVNGKLASIKFEGGCDGNLKALGVLLEGVNAKEAVKKLKGLQCNTRGTSCADQLTKALELYL